MGLNNTTTNTFYSSLLPGSFSSFEFKLHFLLHTPLWVAPYADGQNLGDEVASKNLNTACSYSVTAENGDKTKMFVADIELCQGIIKVLLEMFWYAFCSFHIALNWLPRQHARLRSTIWWRWSPGPLQMARCFTDFRTRKPYRLLRTAPPTSGKSGRFTKQKFPRPRLWGQYRPTSHLSLFPFHSPLKSYSQQAPFLPSGHS